MSEIDIKGYVDARLDDLMASIEKVHHLDEESQKTIALNLLAWKAEHNSILLEMTSREAKFITKSDHETIQRDIAAVQRLVYMGLGGLFVLQVLLSLFIVFYRSAR